MIEERPVCPNFGCHSEVVAKVHESRPVRPRTEFWRHGKFLGLVDRIKYVECPNGHRYPLKVVISHERQAEKKKD